MHFPHISVNLDVQIREGLPFPRAGWHLDLCRGGRWSASITVPKWSALSVALHEQSEEKGKQQLSRLNHHNRFIYIVLGALFGWRRLTHVINIKPCYCCLQGQLCDLRSGFTKLLQFWGYYFDVRIKTSLWNKWHHVYADSIILWITVQLIHCSNPVLKVKRTSGFMGTIAITFPEKSFSTASSYSFKYLSITPDNLFI